MSWKPSLPMSLQSIKRLVRNAAAVPAAAVLTLGAVVAVAPTTQAQQMSRDNSTNSIINGGTLSTQEFVNKAQANNPNDLQAIYQDYGLGVGDYNNFQQNAKMGVAHRNGDVTVDGRVVARNAYSLGRDKKAYSTNRVINGKTYYESRAQDVFQSNTIPAMVMLDNQGRYRFGVLTACGNPMRATPVTPAAQPQLPRCDQLQVTPATNQANTYSFTTRASNSGGGSFTRVVYDFGDKSPSETRNSGAEAVTHTYTMPGTYTASVTVYFRADNGAESAITSASCQAVVTVQAPPVVPPAPTPAPTPVPAPIVPTPVPPAVTPAVQPAPVALPKTGIGETLGLVAAVSLLGSAGYYIYARRRLINE